MEPYYTNKLTGYIAQSGFYIYETIYPASDIANAAKFVRAVDGRLSRNKNNDIIISYPDDRLFEDAI